MQLITNVALKVKPLPIENKARFYVECPAINTKYDLELEYDGRDVFITFPLYKEVEITKLCQLVFGLFHMQSNFKRILFKEFSFLPCKKKIEYIFFQVNGITICVSKASNPYELMREYFREQGYVVFENDTECEVEERNRKLLQLYMFVYELFLQEVNNTNSKLKKDYIFFTSEKEKKLILIRNLRNISNTLN